jgi:predicted DNA-binding transcriptional regulator
MEWGFKENRVAVIAHHKCGKSDSQIFELLKPLKISRKFVYGQLNVIRKSGVLKTGLGQDAHGV